MSGVYRSANATVSAHGAAAVTPSDATEIPVTRALYVGGSGDIAVLMGEDTNSVVFASVPGGFILPIQVSKVLSTGTTATNVLALY